MPCDTLCRPLGKTEGRSCHLASVPLSLSDSSREAPPALREPRVPSSPHHQRSWEGGRSSPFIAHLAHSLGQDVQYSGRGALGTPVVTAEGSEEREMTPHSPPHSPLQGRKRWRELAVTESSIQRQASIWLSALSWQRLSYWKRSARHSGDCPQSPRLLFPGHLSLSSAPVPPRPHHTVVLVTFPSAPDSRPAPPPSPSLHHASPSYPLLSLVPASPSVLSLHLAPPHWLPPALCPPAIAPTGLGAASLLGAHLSAETGGISEL